MDNQLELIDMFLNYDFAHLLKDAEIHFKKAVDRKLPKSVSEIPKNFFRVFYRLGHQHHHASNFKKHLYHLIQNLKPILKNRERFNDEYERFDMPTEYFFYEA